MKITVNVIKISTSKYFKKSFCMSSHNEYFTTFGTQKLFFEKDTSVYNTMMCCKKKKYYLWNNF